MPPTQGRGGAGGACAGGQVQTLLFSNYLCFSMKAPLKLQETVCSNTPSPETLVSGASLSAWVYSRSACHSGVRRKDPCVGKRLEVLRKKNRLGTTSV